MIVLGFLSAVILEDDIRGEFKYKVVSTMDFGSHQIFLVCLGRNGAEAGAGAGEYLCFLFP